MGEPQSSYAADFSPTTVKDTCDICKVKATVKYMHHKNPNKLGRHLCSNCYQQYINKEGTVRRSTTQTAHASEYRQAIHKQIAKAQRGHVSNDVQAVGHASLPSHAGVGEPSTSGYVMNMSMGPMRKTGPAIHLPGYPPQQDAPPIMHLQGGTARPVGYTAEHAMYSHVRHERIREAYSTYNAEVVVVDVRLVVKLPGRVKESLIHVRVFTQQISSSGYKNQIKDCTEAVDHIPVHIGAIELKKILYDAVLPKWREWTNNFPLPLDDVVMRNHNWVVLAPKKPDLDAIADLFFKRAKKGSSTFKGGKCIINLHVPNHIHNAMLTRKEVDEFNLKEKRKLQAGDINYATADFKSAKVTSGKKRIRTPSPRPSLSPQSSPDIEIVSAHVKKRSKVISEKIQITKAPSATEGRSNTSTTKTHPPSPSAQRISQALKAQRFPTNKEISPFCKCMTDLQNLNRLLILGEVNLSMFSVLAYPVESWSWDKLIYKSTKPTSSVAQGEEKQFYLHEKPLSTTLRLDLSASKVKKGGFKVAAFGTSTTSLFKSNGMDICAKRAYHTEERVIEKNGTLLIKSVDIPYEGRKQFQELSMEITCIVWAQALLDLVYIFISQEGQPPFNIPKFRFVESAIAMESSLDDGKQRNAVFLVEEVITEEKQGPFRKYLNNVSPVPLMMTGKEDEDRAKFLAFSQHIQYWKTKKQVFVSDYQGGNSLLTDPQMSSAPSLGRIFGGGNIASIHRDFEKKHECNRFCKWFNVPTDYESWEPISDDDELELEYV